MWTRSQLKEKAKLSFKANYWKSVLVALLLAVLVGTSGGAISGAAGSASGNSEGEPVAHTEQFTESTNQDGAVVLTVQDGSGQTDEITLDRVMEVLDEAAPLVFAVLAVVFIIVAAIAIVIKAFLINPLEIGGRRFFTRNLNQQAPVRELAYAYDHGYRNVVKTVFLRDLQVIGWTLLLVIPGIIKHYEYLMVPYLLGEDANLSADEAFAQSRELMSGNKMRAFVLDLSFIGWDLLVAITLGIAGVFYVNPYREQTRAALYEVLRYGDGMPDFEALPEA